MITIFTPTYNRVHTLPRLYESLNNQTDYSFEWIIIDDASTDKTEEYIDSLKKENTNFEIIYQKQIHGGKHRAINKAVELARYDWFFIVDSDDFLTKDAVKNIENWIKTYGNEKKLAAFSGCKKDIRIDTVMSCPSILSMNPGIKCLNHERCNFDLERDKAEIYRTKLLRQYKFPEYDDEYFVTEAVCWNRISLDGYYTRFFPEPIYLCEYMEDGLTKSGANTKKGFSKSFYGFLDYLNVMLKCYGLNWENINLVLFACRESKKNGINLRELAQLLDIEYQTIDKIYKKRINIYIYKILKIIERKYHNQLI